MKIKKCDLCIETIVCDFEKYLIEHIYSPGYTYMSSEKFAFDYASKNYPDLPEEDKNEFCSLISSMADVIFYKRHLKNILIRSFVRKK